REAASILAGVVTLIGLVTLRQQYAGAAGTDTAALTLTGQALLAVHNWTFLIGPGLVVGVHTVVLAYTLHRSSLVTRFIPILGLVGGPLVFASNLGVMFGAYPQESGITAVGAVPVFVWEISLAAYLIVKGLKTHTDQPPRPGFQPGQPGWPGPPESPQRPRWSARAATVAPRRSRSEGRS